MSKSGSIFIALLSILLTAFAVDSMELEPETAEALESETAKELLLFYDVEELINIKTDIASNLKETTGEAPSSVTIFTQADIRNMGISTIEELLNYVPGFQAAREVIFNQGYRISARGVTTSQESENILFMIDGQRLNEDLSGGAMSINRFLTTANVERVEIIRGPGSALYGTSAFTGVVNIVTTKDMNNAFASAGDLNSQEYYFNLNQQVEKWKVSLFARHYEDDGDTYGPDVVEPLGSTEDSTRDPRDIDDVYLKLSWDEKIQINYRYHQPTMKDFISRSSVKNGVNFTQNKSQFIRLSYKPVSTDKWEVDLHGSYSKNKEERQVEALRPEPGETQLFLFGRKTIEEEFALGLKNVYRGFKEHELLAGFSYRVPDVTKSQETSNRDTGGGEVIEIGATTKEGSRDIIGVFVEDKYRISDFLNLTAGVRYDRYSDFGSTTNPRTALVYSPGSSTRFKLLYGEAFRAPSVRQATSRAVGNPDLKPEKVRTVEIAWIQKFLTAQTTATFFHNTFEDKIDVMIIPAKMPPLQFVNLSDSPTTQGVELEAFVEIGRNFFLRSTYTYLFDTEEDPRQVAEQTFSFAANYFYGPLNLNLNGYYHGDTEKVVRLPGERLIAKIDDYWVLNSTVILALSQHIDVVGKIQNLLDEDYFTSSTAAELPQGAPNRGRTYSVGLNVRF